MFELVLPKACMVGHVDFKFLLNANIINIPQIQVTLLKNKAPGLGKVSGKDTVLRWYLFCKVFSTVTILNAYLQVGRLFFATVLIQVLKVVCVVFHHNIR